MYSIKKLSNIDGTDNFFIPGKESINGKELSDITGKKTGSIITNYQTNFARCVKEFLYDNKNELTLVKLEIFLKKHYSTEAKYLDENKKVRFANCFAWANTQIHRSLNNIVIPDGQTEMPSVTNMGKQAIDPIGWASKAIAPSGGYNHGNPQGYGSMGKVRELRPMDKENFNQEIYDIILNGRITIEPVETAIESGDQEIGIISSFRVEGLHAIIAQFSEKKNKGDIETAKYYGINNY